MDTIHIIRSGPGWLGIDGATIPPDQADRMNYWLAVRDAAIGRRMGVSLAKDIERLYPGGLEGWARKHGCTIETEG